MAELSDVEKGLVTQVAAAVYPNVPYTPGTLQPSSVTGTTLKLYRGYPLEVQLDADLANNVSHISVFPSPGMARNSTRYLRQYQDSPTPDISFFATVNHQVVNFSGTPSADQVVGVAYDDTCYLYRMLVTDTPDTVAAMFAAHIPGATAIGQSVTLTTNRTITATVMRDGRSLFETKRQEQIFRISVWAATPALRDVISGAIDASLSDVRLMTFADGSSSGPIWYRGTHVDDIPSKEHLWIRHLNYAVDYPTVLNPLLPRVIFIGGKINGGPAVTGPQLLP